MVAAIRGELVGGGTTGRATALGISAHGPSPVIGGPGVFIRDPVGSGMSFSGTDRRLTPKLFSFAQEPIEIDGLVKILSGLKPNRIHEPRGREVCP